MGLYVKKQKSDVEHSGDVSIESGASLDIESGGAFKIAGVAVTASAAELNLLGGGAQASNLADIAVTYSSNDPSITADDAITIANGSTPTVAELLEFCEELNAKVSAIIDALEGFGVSASS